MLDFAFDILNEFANKKYGKDYEVDDLKIKIGIHGGKVVTDILGFHKIQFSLFGDPVNTTSRIASNAEVNTVTISDYIFQKLKDNQKYNFEEDEINVIL